MRNVKRAASLVVVAALLLLAVAGAAFASGGTAGMMGTTVTTATTGGTMMGTHDGTHMGMFPDTSGQWYQDMAQHMAEHGFMYGYTDGRFGGADPINRAQFAAIMARMLGISPVGTSNFSDMHNLWAEGAVAAMAKAGVIAGHPDGTFGPYEPITRAQMVTMMDRARTHLGLTSPEIPMTQLYQHLGDVAGHWAAGSIDHMYCLGIVQGDTTGQFHPDAHTNRAQAAAMLWRWYEAR